MNRRDDLPPDQRMPDKKQITDEALDFLRSQLICVVSWNSSSGHPAAATVFYWMHDHDVHDTDLYFVTRRSSRKYEDLLRNKDVAVVVGTEFAPQTIQLHGRADLVTAADAIEDLKALMSRFGTRPSHQRIYAGAFFPKNPFRGIDSTSGFAIFRVKPDWMRYMGYDKEKKEIYFQQILP